MNAFTEQFVPWFTNYFLLSTLLLGLTLVICWRIGQPARRLALARPTLIVLLLLAGLCALPGWSLVHLLTEAGTDHQQQVQSPVLVEDFAPPSEQPAAPLIRATIVEPRNQFTATPSIEFSPSLTPAQESLPWEVWLIGAYLGGCFLSLIWQASGGVLARRIVNQASPAPTEYQALLAGVVGTANRAPRLLTSNRIQAPAALGLFHPTILLPENILQTLPESLRPILAHEWAHIRHGDLWTLATARKLMVLLWPQPLYWQLRRQIHRDQEMLADVAGALVSSRAEYADQLVSLARVATEAGTPRLASSVGLWESPSQLQLRIGLLLDEKLTILRSCSRGWRIGSALGLVVLSVGLSLVTLTPTEAVVAEVTVEAEKEEVTEEAEVPITGALDFHPVTPIADSESGDSSTVESDVTPSTTSLSDKEVQKLLRPLHKRFYKGRKPNEIHGICVDEMGRPLKGVLVRVYPSKREGSEDNRKSILETKSDRQGAFRFTDVVDIDKEFPDGIPEEYFQTWPAKVLTIVGQIEGRVPESESVSASRMARYGSRFLIWRMVPATTLRGRVTDEQGLPVAGAIVSTRMEHALGNPPGINTAKTDAKGEFVIADLAPFDAEELRRKTEAGEPPYGSVLTVSSTGTLIAYRQILSIKHSKFAARRLFISHVPGKVDVQLQPGCIIEGKVKLPAGVAQSEFVTGSIVRLERVLPKPGEEADNRTRYELWRTEPTAIDETGSYRFESLPVGKYHLTANVPGWRTLGIENVPVDVGQTTIAPDILLTHGGQVRIQLVDAKTGQPMRFEKPTKGFLILHPMPERPAVFMDLNNIVEYSVEGIAEIQHSAGKYLFFASIPLFEGDKSVGRLTSDNLSSHTLYYAPKPTHNVEEGALLEIEIRMSQQKLQEGMGTVVVSGGGHLHVAIDSIDEDAEEESTTNVVPASLPVDTTSSESDAEE